MLRGTTTPIFSTEKSLDTNDLTFTQRVTGLKAQTAYTYKVTLNLNTSNAKYIMPPAVLTKDFTTRQRLNAPTLSASVLLNEEVEKGTFAADISTVITPTINNGSKTTN